MVTIPQSRPGQSTMLPNGKGYSAPLPIPQSTPKPKPSTGRGGGSGGGSSIPQSKQFPQSTPAGTPPLNETSSQTLQRQNVMAEYEALRRDQSLVLQTKVPEQPRAMGFISDKPGVLYGGQTIISKGFPVGTLAESEAARKQGFSLFGVGGDIRKPEAFVENISLSSEVITNYKQLRGSGSFKAQQQMFAEAGAYTSALTETKSLMLQDSMQSQQFPQSKDYGAIFGQLSEKKLADISGFGKQSLKDLPTGIRTELFLRDVGTGALQYGQSLGKIQERLGLEFAGGGMIKSGEEIGFKSSRLDKTYYGGFSADLQNTQLGFGGKGLQLGTTAFTLGVGSYQGFKLIKAEGFNTGTGMLLEGLSPVQSGFGKGAAFKLSADPLGKIKLISTKVNPDYGINLRTQGPLQTVKLGDITRGGQTGALFTSRGQNFQTFKTDVKYFSMPKAQLFPTRGASYLDTGSLTSLGSVKSLSYQSLIGVKLKPENIAGIRELDEGKFISTLRGKREVTLLGSQLKQTSAYDLGTNRVYVKELQSFKGTSNIRIFKQNDFIKLGLGKTQISTKVLERQTFNFNGNTLVSAEFKGAGYSLKGFKLPGRPSIIRSYDIYTELKPTTQQPYGKLGTEKFDLTLGRAGSVGKAKGKPFGLVFSTETYIPKKSFMDISDSNLRGFTTFKGGGRKSGLIGISGPDVQQSTITKQISSTLKASVFSPTIKTPGLTTSTKQLTSFKLYPITTTKLGIKQQGGLITSPRLISSQLLAPAQSYKLGSGLDSVIKLTPALRTGSGIGSSFGFNFATNLTPPTGYGSGFIPVIPPTLIVPGIPGLPSLGGDVLRLPKAGRGRKTGSFKISASFTGLQLGIKIKSPVKASRTFGVTPFQRRGIYTGKGPYSKLVDF